MASGRVYAAIRSHLEASWTKTPLAFENEDKDKDGHPLPPNPPATYVEVNLAGRSYDMQSLGADPVSSNSWDEKGTLFLDVTVPKGQGAVEGRTLAKQLVDLFRGTRLLDDSLEFGDAGIGEGRRSEISGAWWVIPAYVEWWITDEPLDDVDD